MDAQLKLLVIEDSPADFLLLERHLRHEGMAAACTRIDNLAELDSALSTQRWDVVLADYSVPGMAFGQALDLIRSRQSGLPVILVSGVLGEERAVDLLKLGCADFVLKGNMARLVPVIERSLREVAERQARRQAEEALRESEERYRSVIAALLDGIILMDADGAIRASNASAERILGLSLDELTGRAFLDPQWQPVHEDGSPFPGERHPAWVTLQTGQPAQNVIMGFRKPGGPLTWLSINSQPLYRTGDSKPYAVVASFADITERRRTEEELLALQARLREEAIHDSLTGLYNRRYLEEALKQELARAGRAGRSLSLFMGDLDYFKQLNDTYGHQAGDEVLRALGRLLRSHVRASDIPCRYGGEEFVVVLPDIALEAAWERAEWMRRDFADLRIAFRGRQLDSTLSIGVSIYPGHGKTGDELISAADQALYGAKQAGRNRVRIASNPPPIPVRYAPSQSGPDRRRTPQTLNPEEPPMSQNANALIESYYAAFNAGDMDTFLSLLTDDVIHDTNQGTREIGKAPFKAFMDRMNRNYKEQLVDMVIMSNEAGDRAAAEFVVLGEYLVTDEGLPEAKGQKYRLPAGAFFDIRDGKVARITNYYNLEDWIRQVSQ